MPNEVSYYPQIQRFIEDQIKSNFAVAAQRPLYVYWGIGELKSNLQRIIQDHPIECSCAVNFAKRIAPLNLDIFALITDGQKFEILILEVKLLKSAGLKEWSQLVGYCLVSGAKYGLLVNIDGGASSRLSELLLTSRNLSHIVTQYESRQREHYLGFMQWDSLTKNFEYTDFGIIKTISELTDRLILEFAYKSH